MQVINQDKVKWGNVISQTLIFIILPPIIGLPYVISRIWNKVNATISDYYAYFGAMAAYFGSINATKVPSGDQVNYYYAYMNVPIQGFIGSLKNIYGYSVTMGDRGAENISGEFMNGVFNYIGYYLTLGYYPLFEFLLTIAMFFFIYLAIHRFCKTLENPHIPIVCGVLILSYFYIFFQFTLHIQKQFLAQCIMMYVMGCYAETGKMTKGLWATAMVAVFTHASTTLFIPFLYYKPMWGRMNRNAIMVLSALFVAGIFYGPRMASEVSVDDMTVAGYGIDRLARSEENNDGGSIPFAQLVVVVGPVAWICFKKLWYERKRYLSPTNAFVLNIALLLILTVAAMQRQPTAQYRFFMMLYAFVPFVMPFMSNGIRMRDNILKGVSIFMIGWFYFQFEKIIWQYASEMRILMSPPLALIGSGFDGFQWVF